jgi:hypothetical protein
MKKLLIFLFIFTGCQKMPIQKTDRNIPVTYQLVNVGTTANDHTGDPLRTAFQKQNTNWNTTDALFGTIYSETETKDVINDTLNARIAAAYNAVTYFFAKADSNQNKGAITKSYFDTYSGGGGSAGGYEWTSFVVGTTTGAPANATTNLTIAGFAGYRMELYRGIGGDMPLQWLNEGDTNTLNGYRYNSLGKIIVKPAWATGDMAYIRAVPAGYTTKVALTGSGGGSSLLTGLLGSWSLNEPSGITFFDNTANSYDGTRIDGTPSLSGKFGSCYDFDGVNDYATMGTAAGLRPVGNITISVWIKTTQAAYGTIVSNYISYGGNYYGWKLGVTNAGKIEAGVYYGTNAPNEAVGTTTINDNAWHNVIFTYTAASDVINVYVDNAASEATNNVAGTITYYTTNEFHVGDRGETDLPFDGLIDEVNIWTKIISSGERTVLQTYAYPFE